MNKTTQATLSKPEFLTTQEVAALLRVKERKVYELVAARAIPFRKLTGKLLFSRMDMEAWMGGGGKLHAPSVADAPRPLALVGSHDPLLEWALRESGCGIPALFDGSGDGLDRFVRGEAVAAGLHILDPATGAWNKPLIAERFGNERVVLVEWARRSRGFILSKNTPHKIEKPADVKGLRLVSRQPGAGAQILWEDLRAKAGLQTNEVTLIEPAVRDEADVALAVAQGKADVGLGLACNAQAHGLDFVALLEERYDLLLWRRAYFEPPLQSLLAFCKTRAFAAKVKDLGGYDIAGLGKVRFNGA